MIEEGEADVVSYNFGAQKAHIYEEYADFYMEKDNYDSALAVLNEGYDATGDESLLLKMKIAYKDCAQSALETENYTYAHTLLYECYDKTGDETLLDDIANVYLANAEKILEDGDFVGALTVLDSGISDLDAEVIKEKKEAILEKVYILSEMVYSNGVLSSVYYYAEDGTVTENLWYSENGDVSGHVVYDENGNVVLESYPAENKTSEYVYDDEGVLCAITTLDQDQNVISNTSYTYDDNGNMISYITVSMEDGSTLNSESLYMMKRETFG